MDHMKCGKATTVSTTAQTATQRRAATLKANDRGFTMVSTGRASSYRVERLAA
jgi:hypothetical protein